MADHVDFVLEQWATERPDLDMAPMAVVGRLLRVTRRIDAELDRAFSAHSLDRPAFDVLATLRRAGSPHRLTPAQLMRASMVTSGAITQRLDRLERPGLVTRSPSEHDGRGVDVTLTAQGKRLIDAALPDHLANEQRLLAGITPTQGQELTHTQRRALAP